MAVKGNKSEILNGIIHGYGLDHEWAVFREIIEICGLDFDEFIDDETLLTKELLESHYDDILVNDPYDENNPEYFKLLYPIVLGAIILQIGARLPNDLQKKINDLDIWDIELKQRWRRSNEYDLENKINARTEFQEMIRNYESGKVLEINPYCYLYSRTEEELEFFLQFFNAPFIKPLTKEDLEEKLDEIINNDNDLDFDEDKVLTSDEIPLTKEQTDNIKKIIKDSKGKGTPSYFIILGVHILNTGASIPENLKQRIIETAERQKEVLLAEADILKKRKDLIIAFKDIISSYKNVF